jgi:hypothetical protein
MWLRIAIPLRRFLNETYFDAVEGVAFLPPESPEDELEPEDDLEPEDELEPEEESGFEDEPESEEPGEALSEPLTFFFLPVLKSVSYQPAPFKRNPAAEISLLSFGSLHAGQSLRASSESF